MQSEPVAQEQTAEGTWVDIPADAPSTPPPSETPQPKPGDAPDDEEHDEPAKTPEAKPTGKPRKDPEARIAQVIARQKEAERRAEEAERRAADRERELNALKAPKPPEKPVEKPAEDKFPDYAGYLAAHPEASLEEWMDARDEWRDAKREKQIREQTETTRLEETFKTKASSFGERFAQAAKADPDLPERLDQRLLGVRPYSMLTAQDKALIRNIADPAERDAVAFRCFLADQWIDSEHAVALLEHLSDPQEFQRLATLPPNQVIRELAKVESRFSAAPDRGPAKETPPPTSKAPPPVQPLRSSPHVSDDEPGDDASDDEWARWEIARMKRSRASR